MILAAQNEFHLSPMPYLQINLKGLASSIRGPRNGVPNFQTSHSTEEVCGRHQIFVDPFQTPKLLLYQVSFSLCINGVDLLPNYQIPTSHRYHLQETTFRLVDLGPLSYDLIAGKLDTTFLCPHELSKSMWIIYIISGPLYIVSFIFTSYPQSWWALF